MKFKKITAFIMSMALTLSCAAAGIPGTVYGESSEEESLFEGAVSTNYMYSTSAEKAYDICIRSVNDGIDTFVIPSEYNGVKISGLLYCYASNIKNIVFPSDFNTIDMLNCNNLECIVLPDNIKDEVIYDLKKDILIIGKNNSFASYFASANGNPFRPSGDINDDGTVSAVDFVSMISYLKGRIDADEITKLTADIDHDGRISIADIIQMKSLLIEGDGSFSISGGLAAPDLSGLKRAPYQETDSSLSRFSADITDEILLNTEDKKGKTNTVYSPLSLYMAMSVLAECSDTETLDELLDLLHADSKDDLRKINRQLFTSMYSDNYVRYNKMANSIWLDNGLSYNRETTDRIAEYYYSSVFEKDLQLQEDLDEISEWIYSNTSGKLKPELEPMDEVVKILNTVTFKESWEDKFTGETEAEFTLPDSSAKICTMMTGFDENGLITENEKYIRYSKAFKDGYRMNFVLPAEGYSTDDIISDGDLLNEMFSSSQKEEKCYVNAVIPSYDIASKFDLIDAVSKMGVNRIFNDADFSPLCSDEDLYVSKIEQEAVLTLNKEGCEAAAYTMIDMRKTAVINTRRVDFTADRPFIYYISDNANTPLFVGVINDPTEK